MQKRKIAILFGGHSLSSALCMDRLAADITGAPDIAPGDTAALIGNPEKAR